MRRLSRATWVLVGVGACCLVALVLGVVRRGVPSQQPRPAPVRMSRGDALVACARPMRVVAPPRCEPVQWGGVVEFYLDFHRIHPLYSHYVGMVGETYHASGVRLRHDGSYQVMVNDGVETGCGTPEALRELARIIVQMVPADAWQRSVTASDRFAPSEMGEGVPLLRVTRVSLNAAYYADVPTSEEYRRAMAAFLEHYPSYEHSVRARLAASERTLATLRVTPEAPMFTDSSGSGHEMGLATVAMMDEEGWYFVRDAIGRPGPQRAGRFDPAQARQFVACLRAGDALHGWSQHVSINADHLPDGARFEGGGAECPLVRAWRLSTGFNLPLDTTVCGASVPALPGTRLNLEAAGVVTIRELE